LITAVLGLGNILLRDEGVGVRVVEAIRERFTFSPDTEIIDGGTLGLDLLPLIEGKDQILIVDAVDFGKEPGYIAVLTDDQIPAVLAAKMSVHSIGLSDVLFAAKLLDITPGKLYLIGIQPESLEVGLDMTKCITDKMEQLVDLAIEKLREWKVECVSLSPQKLSA
jgi:hydrogenase maturation protease